jgi:hypothetical protein
MPEGIVPELDRTDEVPLLCENPKGLFPEASYNASCITPPVRFVPFNNAERV